MRIVVMGPSGSGKSLVGAAVAAALRAEFIDGDDLHPRANIAKMSAGVALTDADRAPWLDAVAHALHRPRAVVACSALRRTYRDRIRSLAPGTVFVELVVTPTQLRKRVSRRDHFMPASLIDSQLDTLEPLASDEAGFRVANDADLPSVVARITALVTGQSLR
ncbi:gluconokinase [Microbacterium sp.]|uniref:gluconokinase n=1 Tax=Microbacterium sp. TaxID=51671 RepID=UPI00289B163D|nr:gluconokinase, GntK/IdnK-type [Microbacterium sp.]